MMLHAWHMLAAFAGGTAFGGLTVRALFVTEVQHRTKILEAKDRAIADLTDDVRELERDLGLKRETKGRA